jgi:hypothetical protein
MDSFHYKSRHIGAFGVQLRTLAIPIWTFSSSYLIACNCLPRETRLCRTSPLERQTNNGSVSAPISRSHERFFRAPQPPLCVCVGPLQSRHDSTQHSGIELPAMLVKMARCDKFLAYRTPLGLKPDEPQPLPTHRDATLGDCGIKIVVFLLDLCFTYLLLCVLRAYHSSLVLLPSTSLSALFPLHTSDIRLCDDHGHTAHSAASRSPEQAVPCSRPRASWSPGCWGIRALAAGSAPSFRESHHTRITELLLPFTPVLHRPRLFLELEIAIRGACLTPGLTSYRQVLKNARLQSCEGLALPFLVNWLFGESHGASVPKQNSD